ncbi:MAG: succinyl-diaminopimelate desuccinylase [Halanaerobium sp. 4-GBenrich]|jgi:succinyl-diaminopimelate desuccinylase|uniref:Succinyl-diaminopimelate desuccinylase n=1 Tax=Halanaerobium congolense TaxID=54121 RepID=A0A1G6P3S7_9FIRM|nr:dipeptidase PepV [Halanaerobium congolense]KXS50318.1 MAG: succinyl-diaminopimelate desuccinylase [Halanaerobium sp. T82-1]ODS50361.1 MAG: succinyl-diaminopimelate desuccinylase [Halanaerobium sp. 4-GBenrich]OEG62363.1 MAG: dipeptidase PepV [Halanaerobium sp. MDAL1]PTX17130.1 succinyl-diaminopimelate desuccinylase [Halanaerobium congolense]TDP27191.1 succinyl-diaminopimelate desuccinylase [Halanaerobium congolense]
MKDKIIETAESLRDNMILSTQELVRIPSVEAEAAGEYPYGVEVYKALAKAVEISENMGFKTKNIDNQAAHVEMGEGEEILALLCHVDVVPEGSGWTYPPYAAEVHDNKIFGRGTIDDKGPAVAALYAMKIVKDLNIKLNKRVRLILGTNEESGMVSLNYYFKKEKMPELAFSPDATFPAIHAEKGILDLKFSANLKEENKEGLKLEKIEGGNAANMVPDYAEAVLSGINKEELEKLLEKIDYEEADLNLEAVEDEFKISYNGISAHGSLPEDGKNAISYLIKILSELPFAKTKVREFLNFYSSKIGIEYDGASIGCKDQDDVPTALTFNTGVMKGDQNKVEFIVNIRYPVKSKAEKVVSDIRNNLDSDLINVEILNDVEPLYAAKNDPFIQKLMTAYQEFTGDKSGPIAIGGGTYARLVDKGVAFGPLFPGQPELAHQKDEFIEIDDLVRSAAIYAKAIIDIAGVKDNE